MMKLSLSIGNDMPAVYFDNVRILRKLQDSDGDGIPDISDNCPTIANPDQSDIDEDGWGFECDNCDHDWNADQIDTDGDGAGDICDNCPSVWNQGWEDSDGDAVGDECDNCPDVWNEDQLDDNSNGIGNACESAAVDSRAGRAETQLFPNPASEWVHILPATALNGETGIEIRDLRGRLIYRDILYIVPSTAIPVNVSRFEEGVYFIRLSNARKLEVMKLIIADQGDSL